MVEFIERNGWAFAQPEAGEAVSVMLRLAASELSEFEFVAWLRPRLSETRAS